MDLPNEKGTYILIASVAQMKRIEVGQLGTFDIVPGFHAYVGSAFGGGGLRARLGYPRLHWRCKSQTLGACKNKRETNQRGGKLAP
jgi:Uri superfamily endonuclease